MEKESKLSFFGRIKKKVNTDYFWLTLVYFIKFSVTSVVIIYGYNYITHGKFGIVGPNDNNTILVSTLLLTIGYMSRRLKNDIVSNYWKLKKTIKRGK